MSGGRHCAHQDSSKLLNANLICLACWSYYNDGWHEMPGLPETDAGAAAGLHRLLAMCECEKCSKCDADIQTLRRMDSGVEPTVRTDPALLKSVADDLDALGSALEIVLCARPFTDATTRRSGLRRVQEGLSEVRQQVVRAAARLRGAEAREEEEE